MIFCSERFSNHMYTADSKGGEILVRINLYGALCFCQNVYTLVLRHE